MTHSAHTEPVRKVVFVGAESTGKTTTARAMAARLGTVWVPEYAREFLERKAAPCEWEDLPHIAAEQLRLEREAEPKAKGFLFCDTNAVTTHFWALWYRDEAQPDLERMADETQDDYVYFLCGTDVPFEADGMRETEGYRDRHQLEVIDHLRSRGSEYTVLTGTLEERMHAVLRRLETLASVSPA